MSAETMTLWFTEKPWRRALGALVVLLGAALLLSITGCDMQVQKSESGEDKKVAIKTPFGELKAQNETDPKDTGLPVYPNSQRKPSKDDDKGSANVQISGLFGLKVAVVTYVSDDSPEKVAAWYREQMKGMGNFIECAGREKGGEGVTWSGKDDDLDEPVRCEKQEGKAGGRRVVELKSGTQGNQRVVAISTREDGKDGTEFALVRVVLREHGESL